MISKEDLIKKLSAFTVGKSEVDIRLALQACYTPNYLIKAAEANKKTVVRFSHAG